MINPRRNDSGQGSTTRRFDGSSSDDNSSESSTANNNNNNNCNTNTKRVDMQGSMVQLPPFKVDVHARLMGELQREKDLLLEKLARSGTNTSRKIRHELVYAGILDDEEQEESPAMMLLQLFSESPSSSPTSGSSPLPSSSNSTPPPYSPADYNLLSTTTTTTTTSSVSNVNSTVSSSNHPSSNPVTIPSRISPRFPLIDPSLSPIKSMMTAAPSTSISMLKVSGEINKKKRQRTSPDQLAILEQIFVTEKMPSHKVRQQLADQLGMSSRRIQIWFQNKRAKAKRAPASTSLNSSTSKLGEDNSSEDSASEDDVNSSADCLRDSL